MKFGVILAAILGLAAATAIVGWFGFSAVFADLARLGWRSFGFLCLYTALPFLLLGTAWFVLDPAAPLGRWPVFIWARIIRDAGSELLPFSHVGGFVFGARAAVLQGVSSTTAFATTIVDVTTETIAQLGFAGLGFGMLLIRLGDARGAHGGLIGSAIIGLALSAAGAAIFIVLQRRGGGTAEKLAARFLPGAAAQTAQVGKALAALYDNPWRIGLAVAIHLAAWVASAVGVWLALRLAGVEISLAGLLAIESLVAAARSAAFVAPMGIGVQEATYAVVGPLFGLGPDLSLALSLLRRARDLATGVPALLIWQGLEGARALKVRRAAGHRG